MAKGYWVAHIDIRDPEAYKTYQSAIAEVFRKHRGRYLVRGGSFESKEGANRSRHIVVEFPSYQAALAAYHSPEGQAAAAMRQANAQTNLLVLEGHDGPQPSE
jgi:uncharacterized protein (DUF1330 family)